jgi:hypothetical protein
MTTNGLPQATANTIAHYRPAQSLFYAEAKAALRQLIGAKKSNEVRAGTPSAGAIDGVEISAAHQARVARKEKAQCIIHSGYTGIRASYGREAMTALLTASGEDLAASRGFHA